MLIQARLDYHIIILTKMVRGAVTFQEMRDGSGYVCGTCHGFHVEWNKVIHPDNCPVGDLQRLIDGADTPEVSERNYRLANEGLHQALSHIHGLVKIGAPTVKADCVSIINMVYDITNALIEDLKRRKTDG